MSTFLDDLLDGVGEHRPAYPFRTLPGVPLGVFSSTEASPTALVAKRCLFLYFCGFWSTARWFTLGVRATGSHSSASFPRDARRGSSRRRGRPVDAADAANAARLLTESRASVTTGQVHRQFSGERSSGDGVGRRTSASADRCVLDARHGDDRSRGFRRLASPPRPPRLSSSFETRTSPFPNFTVRRLARTWCVFCWITALKSCAWKKSCRYLLRRHGGRLLPSFCGIPGRRARGVWNRVSPRQRSRAGSQGTVHESEDRGETRRRPRGQDHRTITRKLGAFAPQQKRRAMDGVARLQENERRAPSSARRRGRDVGRHVNDGERDGGRRRARVPRRVENHGR